MAQPRAYASGIGSNTQVAALSTEIVDPRAQAILEWWYGQDFLTAPATAVPNTQRLWWSGTPETDQSITQAFGADLERLASGACDAWIETPYNCLAGIVVMDQFSRNIHRGTSKAFELDAKSLAWATHLLETGRVKQLKPAQRIHVLLPLMHSEDLEVQELGLSLSSKELEEAEHLGPDAEGLVSSWQGITKYFVRHGDVVKQWGRFPHRNSILGRPSTAEEEQGLKDGSIAKF